MNEVLKVIENRSSLRQFADRPLTKEDEDAILHAAMRAPSATNRMLYSVLIIRDQELKDLLALRCNNQGFIKTAPFILVFLADQNKQYRFYDTGGTREMFEKQGQKYMYPAEHHFILAAHDAIIAAQNAVIAAESLGVGSCYIGHIVSWFEDNRKTFNLPPHTFPITMLVMGYPQDGIKRKKSERFERKYIVFENKYPEFTDEQIKDMYRDYPCPPDNPYGAENNAQYYYMKRYIKDSCYWESVRSVREALKEWKGNK